jgi:hypothetical protein
VGRSLRHEVEDGVFGAHHADAFKLAARINPNHKGLIGGGLLIAQLDIEQAQLVAFGAGLPTFEQVASFGRGARHEGDPSGVDNWYSQRPFPFFSFLGNPLLEWGGRMRSAESSPLRAGSLAESQENCRWISSHRVWARVIFPFEMARQA